MNWHSFDYHSKMLGFNEQVRHHKVADVPVEGKVVGLQVSISSFPRLHVEAWFRIGGEPLCFVNSGSAGAANVHVPVDITTDCVELWVWAHNMHLLPRDFHVKYVIYTKRL